MLTIQTPLSEAARLARLRELLVLDSAPEPMFDRLARMASRLCGTPIALISLVDDDRQWFKANVGLTGIEQTPRDVAFCAHAIASDALMEVADARLDRRFSANPLVTGDPRIRFYAGAPLLLQSGARVGTLCVIDHQPRRLDEAQRQMMTELAGLVAEGLEMRRGLLASSLVTRGKVQEALLRSEAQYRAIVEDQAELVSISGAEGELEFVNRAYAAHFGLAPEHMLGRSLYEFIDEGDRGEVRLRIEQVLAGGPAESSENRMLAANGASRWVAWTNSLYRDPAGQSLLLSVGRDVTDKKQAAIDLAASQSLLQRTGRVAGVGGWELDLSSQSLSWTDETKRIHDVDASYRPTLESAVGFYAEVSRPRIEAAVRLCMEQGTPWDLELQLVTARGRKIWARAVGAVEFDGEQARRLVGAIQDITTRKELEAQLVESQRFLLQLTDSMPLSIAYVDGGGRYRFVNDAHAARVGGTRDGILGRTHAELAPTAQGDDADSGIVAGALAGRPQRFEFDEQGADGARRIECRLTPDVDAAGQVHGFFSTGIDITDRSRNEQSLRDLNDIVESTTDFVVQTDWRGRVLYMNPAARALTGLGLTELVIDRSFTEFNTDETNRHFHDVIVQAVKASGVWSGETTVFDAHRRAVPVSHLVIAHRDASGRVSRYSSVMRDMSEDVRSKMELERQAATLRSVAAAIPAILSVVDSEGRFRFVNDAFERWAGAHRDSIVGKTIAQVLGRSELERSRSAIAVALSGDSVDTEEISRIQGTERHFAANYTPLWLSDGRIDGFIKVAHDITTHRVEHRRLARLSEQDALTGLLNRIGFENYLLRALDEGLGATLTMLCIDLDHFKTINDRHGHMAGDEVLRAFSQRLKGCVRPADAVCRLGGDEFAVVLSGVRNNDRGLAAARKILDAAADPVEHGELKLTFDASVGIAFGIDVADGWRGLYARADAMLYRAKNAGRGRFASEGGDLES